MEASMYYPVIYGNYEELLLLQYFIGKIVL